MARACIIIPARYDSSRFPAKPLALIMGKMMIQRTWEACIRSKYIKSDDIYIATDDIRIKNAASAFNANVIMTSKDCETGTDRLANANEELNYEIVINVQGDEPVISAHDIDKLYEAILNDPKKIYCGCKEIANKEEFYSLNIPKVVFNERNIMIYMSRSAVPGSKTISENDSYYAKYKQSCIYAFHKEHLKFFSAFGRKSLIEEIEDIELLRFKESKYEIQMITIDNESIAVDIPEDIKKVEKYLKKNQS